MHPRNYYKYYQPDFNALCHNYPDILGKYMVQSKCKRNYKDQSTIIETDQNLGNMEYGQSFHYTINFSNPKSTLALTQVLLKDHFNLDIQVPEGRLIPTVPQKLNYILWIEDLISVSYTLDQTFSSNFINSSFKNHENLESSPLKLSNTHTNHGNVKFINGLDIGTGCCCVYALLGSIKNEWTYLGTEQDDIAYKIATLNLNHQNQSLADKVKLLLTKSSDKLKYNKEIFDDTLKNKAKRQKTEIPYSNNNDNIEEFPELDKTKYKGRDTQLDIDNEKVSIQIVLKNGDEESLLDDNRIKLMNQNIDISYEKTHINIENSDDDSKEKLMTMEHSDKIFPNYQECLQLYAPAKEIHFQFTMCNPPYYSRQELSQIRYSKINTLKNIENIKEKVPRASLENTNTLDISGKIDIENIVSCHTDTDFSVDTHKMSKENIIKNQYKSCSNPYSHQTDYIDLESDMVYKEKEGEFGFILNMFHESQVEPWRSNVDIFTCLIGKKVTLEKLLEKVFSKNLNSIPNKHFKYTFTEFCQGKTMRWAVAWSYQDFIKLPPGKSIFDDEPLIEMLNYTILPKVGDSHKHHTNHDQITLDLFRNLFNALNYLSERDFIDIQIATFGVECVSFISRIHLNEISLETLQKIEKERVSIDSRNNAPEAILLDHIISLLRQNNVSRDSQISAIIKQFEFSCLCSVVKTSSFDMNQKNAYPGFKIIVEWMYGYNPLCMHKYFLMLTDVIKIILQNEFTVT
ncbi:unnamed protein product [Gordionus sp. m RMFG-2023]|uniref:RNA N6-adenosine-methyltransferase mettl16-like n=1 Tax=Gordionus sp. m RMFG-2023 TaxID=3053472 RepID=UPI0030DFB049